MCTKFDLAISNHKLINGSSPFRSKRCIWCGWQRHTPRLLEACVGLCGTVLHWFLSYLSNRWFSVCLGHHSSSHTPLGCGVLQGSVLRPLLFCLYTLPWPLFLINMAWIFIYIPKSIFPYSVAIITLFSLCYIYWPNLHYGFKLFFLFFI